jgi:putative flippase GtrA
MTDQAAGPGCALDKGTGLTVGRYQPAQFSRYAGAGALGTLAHYATLIMLVQGGVAMPVVGSTVGAVAGALVNYLLNYHFTFRSTRAHAHAAPRFAAVAAAGIVLNTAVFALLLAEVGTHYLVAQVVATLVVLVFGYLANRRWTF